MKIFFVAKNGVLNLHRCKVKVLKNFLNKNEIDLILSNCKNFENSSVVTSEGNLVNNYRTSRTCFIDNEKVNKLILKKLKKFNIDFAELEEFQITKYMPGQYYKRHHDYFVKENTKYNFRQRMKTIFVYLKKCDEGGETYFNKINKKFNLKNGDALFWENCRNQNGKIVCNTLSEHEGLPVKKGIKIGMNIWIL